MGVGYRIREIRRKKGRKQSDVASQVGISRPYLSQIEKEVVSNPTLRVLQKLADALGVDISEFLGSPVHERGISFRAPLSQDELESIHQEASYAEQLDSLTNCLRSAIELLRSTHVSREDKEDIEDQMLSFGRHLNRTIERIKNAQKFKQKKD